MSNFQSLKVIQILDVFFYLVLLGVGIYFIDQGKVFEKYVTKRTDFYQFNEPVSEFPTINTNIFPFNTSTYILGKDFNIAFGIHGMVATNLTIGVNSIDTHLKVEVDQLYGFAGMNAFTISPLNFSNEMTNQFYYLTYHFINVELKKLVTRVGINLVTQNNSFHVSGTFRDGDDTELTSKLGDLMILFFSPTKYIYDSDLEECRTRPYNELVLTKVFNDINFTCAKPCQKNYGKVSKQIFGDFPMCENSE